ncbi:hypothetical protein [Aeromonas salmonicida]|uniref:hypothetical protein n=1 Tax=Aeromonas salmonicida TaxID=645 RepID=UPI0038D3AB6E
MKRDFPYGEIYSQSESRRTFINSIVNSGRQVTGMLTSLDNIKKHTNKSGGLSVLSVDQHNELYRRNKLLYEQVSDFEFIGRCIAFFIFISREEVDKDILGGKINLKRKIISISDELQHINNKFPMYCMHPHVELFLSQLSDRYAYEKICKSDKGDEKIADDAIRGLISKFQEKEHLKKVHTFNFNAEKNYKSYLGYCRGLLTDFKKVWVFKLDVYLNDDCFSRVDFERLTSFKNLLLQDKRKFNFFDDLVGHIWRLEYSSFAGFFYHLTFIFDMSNKSCSEFGTIERRIKGCWSKYVSKNQGYCRAIPINDKGIYVTRGVGERQVDIEDDMVEIEGMVSYLTKRDGFAKLKIPLATACEEAKVENEKESKKVRLIGRGKHGKPKKPQYGWIKNKAI